MSRRTILYAVTDAAIVFMVGWVMYPSFRYTLRCRVNTIIHRVAPFASRVRHLNDPVWLKEMREVRGVE